MDDFFVSLVIVAFLAIPVLKKEPAVKRYYDRMAEESLRAILWVLTLGIPAGLIYVGAHFVVKYW